MANRRATSREKGNRMRPGNGRKPQPDQGAIEATSIQPQRDAAAMERHSSRQREGRRRRWEGKRGAERGSREAQVKGHPGSGTSWSNEQGGREAEGRSNRGHEMPTGASGPERGGNDAATPGQGRSRRKSTR